MAEGIPVALTDERSRIEAARRGSIEAWEHLVQAHQQPVFRLAYLLLGDADDAEDIAQETFIRAYNALSRFNPDRPLRPWLMRIATNLCHNWRRSAGRYLAALHNLLQKDLLSGSTSPAAVQTPEVTELWNAVRRLKIEDQQVIYLRYFLDCSEAETAQALNVAAGTVKSRTHRALTRLRSVLEKEFPHMVQEKPDVF